MLADFISFPPMARSIHLDQSMEVHLVKEKNV